MKLSSDPFTKVVLSGRQYHYLQNGLNLDIEMRYEVDGGEMSST
jgi:hypothetical protein